jgi:transcriptional regulator with XRE-family HTH domain
VASPPPLSETLRRLDEALQEKGSKRSELLDVTALAARTALPASTVRTLLQGGTPPDDSVNDRVRARIAALAKADMTATGRRMSDLATDISRRLGVSEYWARQVCDGRKVPSVELLHGLVEYFDVDGGEAFFTDSAADALNRALLPLLHQLEDPRSDPVLALMDRYGVRATDLRMHGSLTREQLERLLEGVLRSVVPPEGGHDQ